MIEAFNKAHSEDPEGVEVDELQKLGLFVCPVTNKRLPVLDEFHEDVSMQRLVELFKKTVQN